MSFSIVNLSPQRWSEYKVLRLEALRNDPQAFLSDFNATVSHPDSYWQQKLSDTTFFAQSDGKLVGMVVLQINHNPKNEHVAEIFGVYVTPGYRGQGIGKALTTAAIAKAKSVSHVKKIRLGVVSDQKKALRLYTGLGFKQVGIFEKEILVDSKYYDEILMEKVL